MSGAWLGLAWLVSSCALMRGDVLMRVVERVTVRKGVPGLAWLPPPPLRRLIPDFLFRTLSLSQLFIFSASFSVVSELNNTLTDDAVV